MDRAVHISGVVTLHGIKDELYIDPAPRCTIVRYDTNTSRWIVKHSSPEIAMRARAASVPDALVPWCGPRRQTAGAVIMKMPWIERGSQPVGVWILVGVWIPMAEAEYLLVVVSGGCGSLVVFVVFLAGVELVC